MQSEANAIAPGKRMLSSMTPTLVFDGDERVQLVTGASGCPYIISTVFEMVSAVVDHGMEVGEAMRAPRFHHQHLPDQLMLERNGFDPSSIDALRAMDHQIEFFDVPTPDWSISATIGRDANAWTSMADPRLQGIAAGVGEGD